MSRRTIFAVLTTLAIGCAGEEPSYFATEVIAAEFGPGQSHGQDDTSLVLGPPRGAGKSQGSLHVVSLGNGGSITVGFDQVIVDGPGDDFVVFENPFEAPGGVFAELGTVEVSADGERWYAFECSATEPPYGDCAGWRPVYLNGVEGPFDESAGGDRFDLAKVGLAEARYVRITDRPDIDGFAGVFDLDAVGIVNAKAP